MQIFSCHNKEKKERICKSLFPLKHNLQTDGQNNVYTRCIYVIEIFSEKIQLPIFNSRLQINHIFPMAFCFDGEKK